MSMKMKDMLNPENGSAWYRYRRLVYGDMPLGKVLLAETVTTLFGWIPGALGLVLRRLAYRFLFAQAGPGLLIGRDVTLRHPHKIRLGSGVVLDDGCVLDAKGENNKGITLGNQVYIGRHTIAYCKNGDIEIGDRVTLAPNCQLFSSNRIEVKNDTVVGAYSYFLSGGDYDYEDPEPFSLQGGTRSAGHSIIGEGCWIGARVTVLDAVRIGHRCVVGAGAVVRTALPDHSLAVGVPARIVKRIEPRHP